MQDFLVNKSKENPPRQQGKEKKIKQTQNQLSNKLCNFEGQFEELQKLVKQYPNKDIKENLKHVLQALKKSRNILKNNLDKMYVIPKIE